MPKSVIIIHKSRNTQLCRLSSLSRMNLKIKTMNLFQVTSAITATSLLVLLLQLITTTSASSSQEFTIISHDAHSSPERSQSLQSLRDQQHDNQYNSLSIGASNFDASTYRNLHEVIGAHPNLREVSWIVLLHQRLLPLFLSSLLLLRLFALILVYGDILKCNQRERWPPFWHLNSIAMIGLSWEPFRSIVHCGILVIMIVMMIIIDRIFSKTLRY